MARCFSVIVILNIVEQSDMTIFEELMLLCTLFGSL